MVLVVRTMDAIPPTVPSPAPATGAGDDKTLVVLCHLSAFLGVGFVLPLVVYLIKKRDGGWAAKQAKEVLNFHLTLVLYSLLIAPLCFIFVGFILLPLLALWAFVLAIVAAVKTGDGLAYRYPLCIRFIS